MCATVIQLAGPRIQIQDCLTSNSQTTWKMHAIIYEKSI